MLESTQTLAFDFDNVIVRGSEDIKENAWGELFDDRELLEKLAIGREKFAHGKGDRYDVIGHIFNLAGDEACRDERVQAAAMRFDTIVQDKIVERGVHSTDLRALQQLSQQMPLYVVSNTPEIALRQTVA